MAKEIAFQWSHWVVDVIPMLRATVSTKPDPDHRAFRLQKLQQAGSDIYLDLSVCGDSTVCLT